MPYFPLFIDLREQEVLIVGGGTVALRKIEKLLPYGARITAAAPHFLPELEAMHTLTLLRGRFDERLLTGKRLVIAATDDHALNHRIALLCREAGIPVNAVDQKEDCTFLFPALVQRGELSVGISTGGSSPSAAIYLKEALQALLPDDFDGVLRYLGSLRARVREIVPEEAARSRIFRRLLRECIQGDWPLEEQRLTQIIREEAEQ